MEHRRPEMITLTVTGPADRRTTIEQKETSRYRSRTNTVDTTTLEIHREWFKPHPNLDAFANRHPHALAKDLSRDLDGWELSEPAAWTAEMTATSESMLESARQAAHEWDTGTKTLDVLVEWDQFDIMPELPIEAALDRLGHLLQTDEARAIDRGIQLEDSA